MLEIIVQHHSGMGRHEVVGLDDGLLAQEGAWEEGVRTWTYLV